MNRWHVIKRLLPLLAGMVLLLSACGREDLSTLRSARTGSRRTIRTNETVHRHHGFGRYSRVRICIYVIIRFRRRPGDKTIPKQVEGNHKLEIIWTVIPFFLLDHPRRSDVKTVFGLAKDYTKDPRRGSSQSNGSPILVGIRISESRRQNSSRTDRSTEQKYPSKLNTADVIHSFWIPSLGGKMDTNPGGTLTSSCTSKSP